MEASGNEMLMCFAANSSLRKKCLGLSKGEVKIFKDASILT